MPGHRTGWHFDTTRSGGWAPDGTVNSDDPWFYFLYNERWQQVAMYQGSNPHPTERGG